jgi:hypothetical protein
MIRCPRRRAASAAYSHSSHTSYSFPPSKPLRIVSGKGGSNVKRIGEGLKEHETLQRDDGVRGLVRKKQEGKKREIAPCRTYVCHLIIIKKREMAKKSLNPVDAHRKAQKKKEIKKNKAGRKQARETQAVKKDTRELEAEIRELAERGAYGV